MLELAQLILRTLYDESGGQIEKPMDTLSIFRARFPAIPARDVASELTALAAEGLLIVRSNTGAALTTDGLRKLGELIAGTGGADAGAVSQALASRAPPPVRDDTDELDLDQIMALVHYTDVETPPPADGTGTDPETPEQAEHPTPSGGMDVLEAPTPSLTGPTPSLTGPTPSLTGPTPSLGALDGGQPPAFPVAPQSLVPVHTQPPNRVIATAPENLRDPASLPPLEELLGRGSVPPLLGPIPGSGVVKFEDDSGAVTRLDKDNVKAPSVAPGPRVSTAPDARASTPPVVPSTPPLAPASAPPPSYTASVGQWEEERTETDKGLAALAAGSSPHAPGKARLLRLRHELDRLTQELTAATTLPVDIWTDALEYSRQLDSTVAKLEALFIRLEKK